MTGQGEGGAVLGEEVHRLVYAATEPGVLTKVAVAVQTADRVLAALNAPDSPLRALVAQARADGAAEERERIAAAMDRKAELADARSESVQGHLRTVVVSEAQTLRWASSYARKKPS